MQSELQYWTSEAFYKGLDRLLITGSRTAKPHHLAVFAAEVDQIWPSTVVAHGGQGYRRGDEIVGGADLLFDGLARARNLTIMEYKANWKLYGPAAGPIRNELMFNEFQPRGVLAFWDGESKGTGGAIQMGLRRGCKVRVVYINEPLRVNF